MGMHGLKLTDPPRTQHDFSSEFDVDIGPSESPEYLQSPQPATPRTKRSDPASKEMVVTYDGQRCEVRWLVDMKNLRKHFRCGHSRQFTLQISDVEVPFLLMIAPDSSDAQRRSAVSGPRTGSSFRKAATQAKMQLKCTDSKPLISRKICFNVSFAAGDLQERPAVHAHDFAFDPLCVPAQDALWDLSAVAGLDERCLVRVTITPVVPEALEHRSIADDQPSTVGTCDAGVPAAVVYQ